MGNGQLKMSQNRECRDGKNYKFRYDRTREGGIHNKKHCAHTFQNGHAHCLHINFRTYSSFFFQLHVFSSHSFFAFVFHNLDNTSRFGRKYDFVIIIFTIRANTSILKAFKLARLWQNHQLAQNNF